MYASFDRQSGDVVSKKRVGAKRALPPVKVFRFFVNFPVFPIILKIWTRTSMRILRISEKKWPRPLRLWLRSVFRLLFSLLSAPFFLFSSSFPFLLPSFFRLFLFSVSFLLSPFPFLFLCVRGSLFGTCRARAAHHPGAASASFEGVFSGHGFHFGRGFHPQICRFCFGNGARYEKCFPLRQSASFFV